jgi:hypothetical protein
MTFTPETMRAFVDCLRKPTNSVVPCSSITKLTLDCCYGVANSQFIELLQSKTIQWNNDQPWSSPLLELSVLHDVSSTQKIVSVMHGSIETLSSEMSQEVHQWCPTIASQLTVLRISLERNTLRLFMPHARRIRLEELCLYCDNERYFEDLVSVIPHMLSHRILCIGTLGDPNECAHIFRDALRQSGSLHSASVCQKTSLSREELTLPSRQCSHDECIL